MSFVHARPSALTIEENGYQTIANPKRNSAATWEQITGGKNRSANCSTFFERRRNNSSAPVSTRIATSNRFLSHQVQIFQDEVAGTVQLRVRRPPPERILGTTLAVTGHRDSQWG